MASPGIARRSGLRIAGTFDQNVEAVRRIRTAAVEVELVGCVAAGIHEFQARLGPLAEGVLAPAQWARGAALDEATEILGGPVVQTLVVEFSEPGEYEYFCDTHPNDMFGTIVVHG